MTVKQLLAILSKLPDQEVKLMIDCPYCGKSQSIRKAQQVVVLGHKSS